MKLVDVTQWVSGEAEQFPQEEVSRRLRSEPEYMVRKGVCEAMCTRNRRQDRTESGIDADGGGVRAGFPPVLIRIPGRVQCADAPRALRFAADLMASRHHR